MGPLSGISGEYILPLEILWQIKRNDSELFLVYSFLGLRLKLPKLEISLLFSSGITKLLNLQTSVTRLSKAILQSALTRFPIEATIVPKA